MTWREFRIVETGETTRDELAADDAYWRHRKVCSQDYANGGECPSRIAAAIL